MVKICWQHVNAFKFTLFTLNSLKSLTPLLKKILDYEKKKQGEEYIKRNLILQILQKAVSQNYHLFFFKIKKTDIVTLNNIKNID